jgi:hypothetical protein
VEPLLSNILQYFTSRNMTACYALLADHCSAASASAVSDSSSSDSSNSSAAASGSTSCPKTSAIPRPPASADTSNPKGTLPPRSNATSVDRQHPSGLLQYIAACLARLPTMSQDPRYTAWKLQQKQRVDMTGLVLTITTVFLAFLLTGRRLLAILGFSRL